MLENKPEIEARGRRLRNALWGLFVGDALAMPAHWYYDLGNIPKVFGGGIRGYVDPPHPHAESFMVGMTYDPDVPTAHRLGRAYDILHGHARFYRTSYGGSRISTPEREAQHGNAVAPLEQRYHYHHGLRHGDNTLGAHLVRVLMRSVIRLGRYDPGAFVEDFVAHLTTPGANKDPYTEVYLRRWFENYSRGLPTYACAELQRNVWSIGSHGGVVRPLVLSMVAPSVYQGLGLAIEHQNLTHRSENVAASLGVLVSLLQALLAGADPGPTLSDHASRLRTPRISGAELFAAYRSHNGPGNISQQEMWEMHTALTEQPFDPDRLVRDYSPEQVVRQMLSTACYPEHGLPLLFYLARSCDLEAEASLLANANAGGDNVHRGMVLGLILGAANAELPARLKEGLLAFPALEREIEAFAEVAVESRPA